MAFVLIPKPNAKVRICLDLAKLNQVFIRPVHRGPTLTNIFPKLNNEKCLSLTCTSSGCHNLKFDERSSYLTAFACQFGRYRYKILPFGAAPADNMFQEKIEKNVKNLPNVFSIADDIIVVGYYSDGKDCDEMLWQVLQICRHMNLKLHQRQMTFQINISATLW